MTTTLRSALARLAGAVVAVTLAMLGFSATALGREVTLTPPYDDVETFGWCPASGDPSNGKLAYASIAWGGRCPLSAYGETWFGAENPFGWRLSRFTATLEVERAYVAVPLDFGLVLKVSPHPGSWDCAGTRVLTEEERRSAVPVTVTNRIVTATCNKGSSKDFPYSDIWAGLSLWHGVGNTVEVAATLKSIVVESR